MEDRTWNRIWERINDAGLGRPIGDEESDINELASEIGGELIKPANNDHDVAVYETGTCYWIVGHAHGPWAVVIDK